MGDLDENKLEKLVLNLFQRLQGLRQIFFFVVIGIMRLISGLLVKL